MSLDPAQALRVGEDGHVASDQDAEKELLQSRYGDVVWGFDEDIAGSRQWEQPARAQSIDEVGNDMVIGAGEQLQLDAGIVDCSLERLNRVLYRSAVVGPDPGHYVGRAGGMGYAIGHVAPGHVERHLEIAGAVVEARQQVAVQINH